MLALIQETSSGWSVLKDVVGSTVFTTVVAATVALLVGHVLETRRERARSGREDAREVRDEKRLVDRESREEARQRRDSRHDLIRSLLPQIASRLERAEVALETGLRQLQEKRPLAVDDTWYQEVIQSLDTLGESLRREIVFDDAVVAAGVAIFVAMGECGVTGVNEDDPLDAVGLKQMHRAFRMRRLVLEETLRVELGWASPALDGDGA